jgi:hypothetical protein
MKNSIRALAFFVVLLLPGVAWCQCNSSTPLPPGTVLGRLLVGPGPCQAIPFATFDAQLNQLNNTALAPFFALVSTPTVASVGFGCPPSSTFNVQTSGGTGTQATLSVTTNSSGAVTAVNSIVSPGAWSATPSTPNTVTLSPGGTCPVQPSLNLSFIGGIQGNAVIFGPKQTQLADAGAPPALTTRLLNTTAPLAGGGNLTADHTFSINANGISNALFRQSGALSLVGQAANSTGNVADISAAANSSCAFIESSGSLICGQLATAGITNNAVDNTKIRQSGALSLVGRSANSTGNVADISAVANSSCAFIESASSLICGQLATAGLANNAVTNAKLATMAANTVKANATGSPAVPTDVAPAAARSSSLLNVDSFTGVGNTAYAILTTDRTVGTNAAFTASRTWTLPAANAVNPGQEIVVADYQGTVTGTNTLVISRAGADTINGGTTATISAANGGLLLRSDGVSKWTSQAFTAGSGISSITAGAGLSGGTITTSGTIAVSLSSLTNSLGADVALNNTTFFFDGPSVAQGATGTWCATGSITARDAAGSAIINAKLWDGTTVIASGRSVTTAANAGVVIALSGCIASPAGNIRISAQDVTSINGTITFSLTGLAKDGTITVFRIQ